MWYPAKGAFRVGGIDDRQWNDINVGDYSVAMGWNTRANGDYAVAMGYNTTASGVRSTAMGYETTASGNYAVAMGRKTAASGFYSTALGQNTWAMGDRATAMGYGTIANGDYSVAMGRDSEASGDYSVAMGRDTEASGDRATAMGDNTTASGIASTATGTLTTANGNFTIAMGEITTASGFAAVAMGSGTIASGDRATAIGFETTAQAFASLVLGQYNTIAGTLNYWVSSDPVLVVGKGSSTSNRSNAFTLLKNGNLTIAGSLTENSDRRLKQDITPLRDALDGLGQLQPVRYRFRKETNHPDGEHIGLIAQEVAAVFPELVSEGADGYLSVSYTHLTAVLVQALNEQQVEIEALKTENTTLHERLDRLEAAMQPRQTLPASNNR